MVVEVKARGRRHSLLYVQGAQRRDRPPGPFRTYNFKVDRVLERSCFGLLGLQVSPVTAGGFFVESTTLARVHDSESSAMPALGAIGVGAVNHVAMMDH